MVLQPQTGPPTPANQPGPGGSFEISAGGVAVGILMIVLGFIASLPPVSLLGLLVAVGVPALVIRHQRRETWEQHQRTIELISVHQTPELKGIEGETERVRIEQTELTSRVQLEQSELTNRVRLEQDGSVDRAQLETTRDIRVVSTQQTEETAREEIRQREETRREELRAEAERRAKEQQYRAERQQRKDERQQRKDYQEAERQRREHDHKAERQKRNDDLRIFLRTEAAKWDVDKQRIYLLDVQALRDTAARMQNDLNRAVSDARRTAEVDPDFRVAFEQMDAVVTQTQSAVKQAYDRVMTPAVMNDPVLLAQAQAVVSDSTSLLRDLMLAIMKEQLKVRPTSQPPASTTGNP